MKYFIKIDRDHPALEGHFPDHPIVPGVVILDQVMIAFKKEQRRPLEIHNIPWVKFLSPLEPGARLEITFEVTNNLVHFTGTCAQQTIVSGQLEFSFSS